MLKELDALKQGMLEAGYICDDNAAVVLFLAQALSKPILVEGPAGVGKTSIAQAFARMKDVPLIRLQCYEGIDEAKAMYEWNYKRQLLHIQAVANQSLDVTEVEKQIFSEEFLLTRPLLQVITSEEQSCLLIDEIDKVDFEFEAMLLELLSEFQITLPELGTIKARQIPFVFLTSNATRELSEALKRRCLYLYLDFPSQTMEESILRLKVPNLKQSLARQVAESLQDIRKLELKKSPSVAESIDWALALVTMGIAELDRKIIVQTLNVLLKYQEDIDQAKARIPGPPQVSPIVQ
ncbi:MAG: AAA family ATPase [Syntrophomonadales bacterium]